MSFHLLIATKRDPGEANAAARGGAWPSQSRSTLVTLVVSGILADAGVTDVANSVTRAFEAGAETVVVELEVVLDDTACLERVAAELMSQRAAGRQVQVVARDAALHAACAGIAGSRDWLIADSGADVSGGRRAFHLDRPSEDAG